ncbi:M protein repeat protein [Lasiodiplodia theobromae]|uniref:M protein repeat protein n=1 Tax=Lasiodiplodia theobromae TaxID=45133 RepID=UPI0015C387EB|nr:M protein repeat protein [Lasiodiplodia theobromae]KAF4537185.1 M protein repeat protein [Lasiodiplodia theobromae]
MPHSDPDLAEDYSDGLDAAQDGASGIQSLIEEADSSATGRDDQERLTKATRDLQGSNWLGEETIMLVISFFMPIIGVRLVDIGQVPGDGEWDTWASSKSKAIRLRESDEIVLVPLFDSKLRHWRLLSYRIAPGTIKVTVYDSIAGRVHLESLRPAILAISQFLGISPQKQLDLYLDPTALQQDNEHDCGVFVIIHAIYIISRATLPSSASGSFWRAVFRYACNLQSGLRPGNVDELTAELDSITATTTEAAQSRRDQHDRQEQPPPDPKILDLLRAHAAANTQSERLQALSQQASEFFKAVALIQYRVCQDVSEIALMRQLSEVGASLSAEEHGHLMRRSALTTFVSDGAVRLLQRRKEAMEALERGAKDFCARVKAEHDQAARAVGDVMERVRAAIRDAAEKVEEAKVRAKDAEDEFKEARDKMKNAEEKARLRAGEVEAAKKALADYESIITGSV